MILFYDFISLSLSHTHTHTPISDFLSFRVYHNLVHNEAYSITFEVIYFRYLECCASRNTEPMTRCKFGLVIASCFPQCNKRTVGKSGVQSYIGLGWRSATPCDLTPRAISAQDVFQEFVKLSPNTTVNHQTKIVMIDTHLSCNGMKVLKEVKFTDDGWSLKVRSVTVDLQKHLISGHYHASSTLDALIIHQTVNNIR